MKLKILQISNVTRQKWRSGITFSSPRIWTCNTSFKKSTPLNKTSGNKDVPQRKKLWRLSIDWSQMIRNFRILLEQVHPRLAPIFEHHFMQIKEELMGQQSALAVVSIIGMGGIGKTTLATNIYNDPSVICQFDFRAWVVVSQSYFIRNILLGILDSMKMLSDEIQGRVNRS